MNKDKLISVIIKKETYKDTKPYLEDIQAMKQETVKICIASIKEILTTQYNAEAKLYAVRFLKDAFEKGNPSFIEKVEINILPILCNIITDEMDEKAIPKYAGSSYTKNQQLSRFKAILSSLFRIAKQCVSKWAEWIPMKNRKFVQAFNELKKIKINFQTEFKYFRVENEELFRQYSKKNGLVLQKEKDAKNEKTVKIQNQQKNKTNHVSKVQGKRLKNPLQVQIDELLKKAAILSETDSKDQFIILQDKFNNALNNYLQQESNFNEDYVNTCCTNFDQFKEKCFSNKKKQVITKEKDKELPKKSIAQTDSKTNIKQLTKEDKRTNVSEKNIQKKITSPKAIDLPNEKKGNRSQQQKVIIKQKNNQTQVKSQRSPLVFVDEKQENYPKNKIENRKLQVANNEQIQKKAEISKIETNSIVDKSIAKSLKAHETSKQQQRVDFSDDDYEQSEGSEDAIQKIGKSEFKKNHKLTSIVEQNSQYEQEQLNKKSNFFKDSNQKKSHTKVQKVKSPKGQVQKMIDIEQGDNQIPLESKTNRNNLNNKLLQQNTALRQKYQIALLDLQKQKRQKIKLIEQKKKLESTLALSKEEQQKMIKKIKTSVPIDDYNKIRIELEEEKKRTDFITKENFKLKKEIQLLNSQIKNKKESDYKSRQKPSNSRISNQTISEKNKVQSSMKRQTSPIRVEQLDPDYAKNLTHFSKIFNWLNEANVIQFKKCVLGLCQLFYYNEYVSIESKINVYTKNQENFISVTYSFQFKNLKSVTPQIKYFNCQQIDLWIKPLQGTDFFYKQDLVGKLYRQPLRIIKANIKIIQSLNVNFLLPFLYFNFLREEDVNQDQFDEIYSVKSSYIIRSKIVQLNSTIIKDISDFKRIFKNATISQNKIKFCLSEGINDHIFLGQLQNLKGSKLIIKILPIPHYDNMIKKGQELLENLTFLVT